MTVLIEPATQADVPLIVAIARRYPSELYVMYPALRESINRGTLLVARAPSGSPVAFVNWRTRIRDGWTTLYEIAVAPGVARQGIGRMLIDAVPRPTRLKCTVDNVTANAFYLSMGFLLVDVDPGKKRALNIWERT